MKQCQSCAVLYESTNNKCDVCGWQPDLIDGFEAYAPVLAHENEGFKSNYFSDLARLEDGSFWFRSRNNLILWVLAKYSPKFQSFLEIGCGTGYVLSAISKAYPQSRLAGSEIFTEGLRYSASRLSSVKLMQMDARNIPFSNEFDAIGAFDVLEHIEDDELVLKQMYLSLKPKGLIVITVPQHEWLWSAADEYAFHARRYSAKDLHYKIRKAGFRVVRSTSFVSTILPAMILSRYFKKEVKIDQFDATSELKINPLLNALFFFILRIERYLIEMGVDFPAGGSRLVVAQKD